ncbi:hypothetical protein VSH64_44135 [Amycolatopsis rhabdoformis]|uniref:Integral membrane protein n=1 Tax=Amycolatopsis rhabdoformis TaxID=1448059 RepID=A0ABZ1I7S4_9PSEU|nr:hypothetical protein [Amycolatopsis rhabdoformis]WSE29710.1 hypothetical protein VSH64_44135 [Amycolatopsis rhabdoformis]
MTPLELRYRRLTRLLPAHYRRAWEDDMVATFVETTTDRSEDPEFDLDYGRPDVREATSVLVLAVRLRLSAGGPRRYVTAGEVVRRLALAGTAFQAALALVTGILRLTWPAPEVRDAPTLNLVLALLWLPALGALLAGHKKPALALAAVATVGPFLLGEWGQAILQVLTVLAILVHPRPTTVHTRQWVLATAGTAVAAFVVQWLGVPDLVAVAGIVTAATGLALLGAASPAARQTCLIAAGVVVVAEAVTLPTLLAPFQPTALIVIAALVVVGAALAVRGRLADPAVR